MLDMRATVALAQAEGELLDLSGCDYGQSGKRGFLSGPRRYYSFLAGLARCTRARRIVEIGTHHGGSARAMAIGQSAAGRDPRVLTLDPAPDSGAGIAGAAGIEHLTFDATTPEAQRAIRAWCGGERPDILYIDALKSESFVGAVLGGLADLRPRWIVVDDIAVNDEMRRAWRRLADRHPGYAISVDDVSQLIREPPFGQGVVAAAGPEAIAAIDVARVRAVARAGWSALTEPATAPVVAAPDIPTMLEPGELAMLQRVGRDGVRGWGEIVDAGCFLGASSVALATGLIAGPGAAAGRRVHAYDRFLNVAPPNYDRWLPEVERLASFRETALTHLGRVARHVNVYDGDIRGQRWIGRPIEAFVDDVSIDPSTQTAVLREFSPWWIPGRTIVVLRGALDPGAWWRHVALAQSIDHMTLLAVEGSSIVLGYLHALPAEQLESAGQVPMTLDEQLRALRGLAAETEAPALRATLLLSEALLLRGTDLDAAQDALARCRAEHDGPDALVRQRIGYVTRMLRSSLRR